MQRNLGNSNWKESGAFEALRQQILLPTVASIIGPKEKRTKAHVSASATVTAAAKEMANNKVAAVLVTEGAETVGIFTTKDVLNRVLSQDRNPRTTIVGDVMTPNPDTVNMETTILDALHIMHDGRFLHLPVTDETGEPIGVVDVLQLTYGIASRMGDGGGNDFWNNVLAREEEERLSVCSDVRSDFHSDVSFMFKLTDASGHVHRFSCKTDLTELHENVCVRVGVSEVSISYLDEDGDAVRNVFFFFFLSSFVHGN